LTDPTEIRSDVNRGLSWVGTASTAVALLDVVAVILILKYWITGAEYGIATKAVWMFPILDLATDLGLSAAVIQRDDHTENKISTVFWLNLGMGVILFGALVAVAPLFASLYGHAVVGSMVVVYATKLLWQNVYMIPAALLRKQLRYKELSVVRIFANLAEFASKVATAAAGFGVWCFVLGPLARVVVTGVGTQICHPWRPRFVLKLREAFDYAVFGFKASASQILFYFYTNIDYPIVGACFGDAALGIYRWAYEVVLEPVRIISEVVKDVAFAAFSRLRQDHVKLVDQFIVFTRLNLVTVISYIAFVFLVADDLLFVLFGDEYLAAAPAIRILSAVGVLRALSFVVPPLLDGMGFPGRTLLYQLVAAITLPMLFLAAPVVLWQYGFLSVAIAWAVGYPIAFVVLAVMALRALELGAGSYLRQVIGIPACAAVAMGIGALARWAALPLPPTARLFVVGAVMLLVLGLLLAYTQGISPRSVARAVRGERPAPPVVQASHPS
jgi:teichuronic acid exporter